MRYKLKPWAELRKLGDYHNKSIDYAGYRIDYNFHYKNKHRWRFSYNYITEHTAYLYIYGRRYPLAFFDIEDSITTALRRLDQWSI